MNGDLQRFLTQALGDVVPPVLLPLAIKVVGLIGILVLGIIAAYVIGFAFRRMERATLGARMVQRDTSGEYTKRVSTIVGLLKAIALTTLWVLVLVMVLSHLGVDITPILASAGILGLAVGFGAQNLVRDIISGVFHIMENQVRVGDVAVINGVGGIVERITYRIIVLRDLEQTVHVIPHGKVETLANHTKDFSAMLIDVGVAYKEHPERVIAAIRDVAQSMWDDPAWKPKLLEPLEVLGLDKFADSAVNYRIRYKTVPIEQWGVKREFQKRLWVEFDKRQIEFPFPHRTLYMGEASPPFQVRLLPSEDEASDETPPGSARVTGHAEGEPAPDVEPPSLSDPPRSDEPR